MGDGQEDLILVDPGEQGNVFILDRSDAGVETLVRPVYTKGRIVHLYNNNFVYYGTTLMQPLGADAQESIRQVYGEQ